MIKRTVFYGVILLLMVIVIIFMYRAVKINSIPKQIGKLPMMPIKVKLGNKEQLRQEI